MSKRLLPLSSNLMERSTKNYFHSAKGMELTAEPVYFELDLAETGIFSVLAKFECGRNISSDRAVIHFEFPGHADTAALGLAELPGIGLGRYIGTRAGEISINYEFPPGITGTVRVGVRALDADDAIIMKSFMALSTEPFEALSERYSGCRDISAKDRHSWRSLGEFLSSGDLPTGMHSIAVSDLLVDASISYRRPDAPLLCYLHSNAPQRSDKYLLPAISGWRITDGIDASTLEISDASLLLDRNLALAWHAGTFSVPLQYVYELIVNKVRESLNPSRVIFWGGSGGGFAALCLSSRIPDSIAFVWNPETSLLSHGGAYVRKYAEVCFGCGANDALSSVWEGKIVADVSEAYPNENNRVVYLQNKTDWHAQAHLAPFLKKAGLAEKLPEAYSGWIGKGVYVHLDEIYDNSEPPPRDMIRRVLRGLAAEAVDVIDLKGVISGKLPGPAVSDKAVPDQAIAAEPMQGADKPAQASSSSDAAPKKNSFAAPENGNPAPVSVRKGGISRYFSRLPFRRAGVLFQVSLIPILLTVLYFGFIASDRYVSEARVIVDRTDFSGGHSMDFASLLTTGGNSHDIMLLRDHLRSVDMLNKLDARLNLKSHYSGGEYDIISRMWSNEASQELFHRHFLSRVRIEMDTLANVLSIRVQAYTPEKAHSISVALVEEGEKFMNEMAHRLAREQVSFLEVQASQMKERVMKTRSAVVAYQNTKGLVSPQGTAETVSTIVAKLEGQLTELKAKRQAMLGYLSPKAPEIAQLNFQIGAYEKQLQEEQRRLAAPKGSTLNRSIEEFQRLQLEAEFAQDTYRTALMALEKGRVEATRTLKKVSVLQSPTMPQYPVEPRRVYNIIVYTIAIMAFAGIIQMFIAIIRDHKD